MEKKTYRLKVRKCVDLINNSRKKIRFFLLLVILLHPIVMKAEDASKANKDLLEQYIKTKGAGIILFDASNIKQFWISNTVYAKKDTINIALKKTNTMKWESEALNIKLANVNNAQNCTIEVISKNADLSFFVFNASSQIIADSSSQEYFVNYHIVSSTFHLEDTQDLSFDLRFQSNECDTLEIDKIVLSFSNNDNYLFSPGKTKISQNDIIPSRLSNLDEEKFILTGKQINIQSKKKIMISNESVKTTVTIKNIGENPALIYIGYRIYSKDVKAIDSRNYPVNAKENEVLKVILAETGNSSITVNKCPEMWMKSCIIGLEINEDLSDIPNFNLLDGRIVEVKPIDENRAEIILDKPLKTSLAKGTKIRILGQGGAFLYTVIKELKPLEEETFSSEICLDNQTLVYSGKAFPRGTVFIQPLILSHSIDSSKENTILIRDYAVSF